MSDVPLSDAVLGGLLGLTAGDALGTTVEFLRPAEIERRYGVHRHMKGGGPFKRRPGQGTDDSDMAWAIASAYLSAAEQPDVPLLEAVAANFLTWHDTNPPDMGRTTSEALHRLKYSAGPTSSGSVGDGTCGNGSLMRTLPTGLVRRDPELRRAESAAFSAITHAHPTCVNSCIAYNEIASALLDGATVGDALDIARSLELDPDTAQALEVDPSLPVTALSTGGYVIDSLTCAIWAIQQPGSFEDLLIALVNRGRDADTTGAIAGGLLGIIHGAGSIPRRWRKRLVYGPAMTDAAPRLVEMRTTG